MGASQSSPSPSRPTTPASPSLLSRPPSSRRLSSFGRRGVTSVVKKDDSAEGVRQGSSSGIEQDKAARVEESGEVRGNDEVNMNDNMPPSRGEGMMPTPSLPTSPGPPVGSPTSQALESSIASYFPPIISSEPVSDSPGTNSEPLPHATPTIILPPPTIEPTRPQSAAATRSAPTPPRPTHSRHLSLPAPASPSISDRTMSGRLTALLGFSAPGEASLPSTTPQPLSPGTAGPSLPISPGPSSPTVDDHTLNADISDLQARLDAARTELLAGQAELAELQQQRAERTARLEAARTELAERRAELARLQARRVPVGAMLVIQGLAQTQITTESTSEGSGSGTNVIEDGSGVEGQTTAARTTRPDVRRRISDGSLFRRRREIQRERGASLDQQARMISGLLTVAAAATANTLLTRPTPPSDATPTRSGVSGAIQSLLDRLRPSRTPRHGIEQALGQYIRNAVRDNRNSGQGIGESTIPDLASSGGADAGAEFQAFLQGLQGDLVGAVRAYAGSVNSEAEDVSEGETTDQEGSMSTSPQAEAGEMGQGGRVQRPETADSSTPASTVPTFHRQLGQNLPGAREDRFGVSGGGDQPRRLNFFRAHVFPPLNNTSNPSTSASDTPDPVETTTASNTAAASPATAAPAADPESIVPCIFIGVRSIRHDPSTTPEELFNQPGLFNGETPASETTSTPSSPGHTSSPLPSSSSPSSTPALSRVMSPPVPSAPRSFRDRFLSRLSRSPTRITSTTTPTNTYLVYVIGGNYPSNHPVLRIPNLISGGPLTDEDMALISELMGPAKPPTASKSDIEQSGLRLVDGEEMRELGEKGEVLDNSTERCLICLGDYEQGEECRVLGCRHGFHKECVDRWLEKGSNSCPACRTEAVDKTKISASQSTHPHSPEQEETPSLSPPIPVTSVPAGGLDMAGPSRLDGTD